MDELADACQRQPERDPGGGEHDVLVANGTRLRVAPHFRQGCRETVPSGRVDERRVIRRQALKGLQLGGREGAVDVDHEDEASLGSRDAVQVLDAQAGPELGHVLQVLLFQGDDPAGGVEQDAHPRGSAVDAGLENEHRAVA